MNNNVQDALLYGKATDEQQAFLQGVLELGLEFIDGSVRKGRVLQYEPERWLRSRLSQSLPYVGMPLGELLHDLRQSVAQYSIAQSDLRYLAFPDTGNSVAGIGADILSAFTNQNLIAFDRSAPAGTILEIQLIQWLRELVGFSHVAADAPDLTLADIGGLWTSGGNMSNHVAMLVALHARFPDLKRHGLAGLGKKPVVVLARGIEHFSFASAALSLGLGEDSLVWTRSRPDFTTDPDALRETLEGLDADCVPFMVVAVAGNCRTTGVDDITTISKICDDQKLWLHVDACHGGSLLFSRKLKGRLAGVENAHSISLDPHKGLFLGYSCSYVLLRDPQVLEFICRYPSRFRDTNCLDLGLIMPFYGSRGFESLKLWSLIKHLGVDGIGDLLDRRQALNERLTRRLEGAGTFQLLNNNTFYRTAFVFFPHELQQLARRNNLHTRAPMLLRDVIEKSTQAFSDKIYQSGEAVFDCFSLLDMDNRLGLGADQKFTAMAMAVGHPDMDQATEDAIFTSIDKFARPIATQMKNILESSLRPLDTMAPAVSKGPAGW